MELRSLDLKGFFFITILVLLGIVMVQVFTPFISVIVVALVIVQLFRPVYSWLERTLRNRGLAGILSTLVAIVFVIIPLVILTLLTISEISNLSESIAFRDSLKDLQVSVGQTVEGLNAGLSSLGIPVENQLTIPNLLDSAKTVLSGIRAQLLPLTTSIVSFSLNALFYAFILIITLIYMFMGYDDLPKVLSRISPLDDRLDTLLWQKFTDTTKAVVRGNFLVAIAQASAVSVMFMILNIGPAVLLWVFMVVMSLIPVGSGLIWGPVGLALVVTGRPIEAVLLVVYSAVIINVIDTLLRPYLTKDAIKLHPLVIIFSVIGGIGLFGPLGLLYGPLIAVFFTSLMDVYTQQFSPKRGKYLRQLEMKG